MVNVIYGDFLLIIPWVIHTQEPEKAPPVLPVICESEASIAVAISSIKIYIMKPELKLLFWVNSIKKTQEKLKCLK